ncbi:SulP family inorganic anion transporter [Fischerella sp. PCC 9605]|uniref:SulP family inorganic anion transporter n=1 Tax=Fischerella sp. PCC 9605 TaxID=1173024 RepID=UPI000479A33F|nr:SulP family inorganic anion transporter [Fischerella sp. PCC 9605]
MSNASSNPRPKPSRAFRFNRATLTSDLIAGATTAIVSVPKLMGFAIMAGVNLLYGLYTGVAATPIAARAIFFGGDDGHNAVR